MSLLDFKMKTMYNSGMYLVFYPEDFVDIMWDVLPIVKLTDEEMRLVLSGDLPKDKTSPNQEPILLQFIDQEEVGCVRGGTNVYRDGQKLRWDDERKEWRDKE